MVFSIDGNERIEPTLLHGRAKEIEEIKVVFSDNSHYLEAMNRNIRWIQEMPAVEENPTP